MVAAFETMARGGAARFRRRAGFAALWLVLAAPAPAAEPVPLSSDQSAAWAGVAEVTVDGRRLCSAALVSPTEAVTAAHCLADRVSGARAAPVSLALTFALDDTGAGLSRGVTAIAILPAYFAGQPAASPRDLAFDLALLRLDAPLDEVPPLAVRPWPVPVGDLVDVPGVQQAGPPGPVLRPDCMVLAAEGGVAEISCDVTGGLSGAPVLRRLRPGAEPELVASVSSRGAPGRAFVVEIAPLLPALRAALDP